MSRIKDLIQDTPIHERRLELRTYPLEDDRLIVEGWLKDEQLVVGYYWDGSSRAKGIVHWMCVRLLIAGWPPSILDAEAEMPTIPHELCPTTLESVKKIIGLAISSGYSEEIHKRLGGVNGCAHLTHLILAMGTAALQGYWIDQSRKRDPISQSSDDFPDVSTLVNTCMLWREGGPMMQRLHETMAKSGDDEI